MQVIRYPWYATSLLGGAPHALTWLRYTAFYALYPVGVVAEMWIIATALPTLASTGLHSISLPNAWNWAFSYHYFMVVRPDALLQISAADTNICCAEFLTSR